MFSNKQIANAECIAVVMQSTTMFFIFVFLLGAELRIYFHHGHKNGHDDIECTWLNKQSQEETSSSYSWDDIQNVEEKVRFLFFAQIETTIRNNHHEPKTK